MKKRWPGFALIAVILVAWEIASATKFIDPVVFPRVSLIFASWGEIIGNGELPQQLLPSLGRIFAGVGLAMSIVYYVLFMRVLEMPFPHGTLFS